MTTLLVGRCGVGADADDTADERYSAPVATDAPGADAVLPDGSTVPAGEWGAVTYMSTDDEPTVVAVRTTGVVVGEAGALADVMVPGGPDLDEATPYYVGYTWVNVTGDESFSPLQNLVVASPEGAVALAVPDDAARCEPRAATDYSADLGHEQRGCAVVVSAAGPPEALVFQGPEGSSKGVSFTVPAP